MRFWTREGAGWLLLGLGLYVFYRDYQLLLAGRAVEGAMLTVIGAFLFRGGIHLLKIAVAAEVCMEAEARLQRERSRPGGSLAFSRPVVGPRSSLYPEKSSLRS